MITEVKALQRLAALRSIQKDLIPKIQKESKDIDLHMALRVRDLCNQYIELENKCKLLSDFIIEN